MGERHEHRFDVDEASAIGAGEEHPIALARRRRIRYARGMYEPAVTATFLSQLSSTATHVYDVDGKVWSVSAGMEYALASADRAELLAATPLTDGSGAYLSGTRRRVLSATTGGAICADEPGGPPPP